MFLLRESMACCLRCQATRWTFYRTAKAELSVFKFCLMIKNVFNFLRTGHMQKFLTTEINTKLQIQSWNLYLFQQKGKMRLGLTFYTTLYAEYWHCGIENKLKLSTEILRISFFSKIWTVLSSQWLLAWSPNWLAKKYIPVQELRNGGTKSRFKSDYDLYNMWEVYWTLRRSIPNGSSSWSFYYLLQKLSGYLQVIFTIQTFWFTSEQWRMHAAKSERQCTIPFIISTNFANTEPVFW